MRRQNKLTTSMADVLRLLVQDGFLEPRGDPRDRRRSPSVVDARSDVISARRRRRRRRRPGAQGPGSSFASYLASASSWRRRLDSGARTPARASSGDDVGQDGRLAPMTLLPASPRRGAPRTRRRPCRSPGRGTRRGKAARRAAAAKAWPRAGRWARRARGVLLLGRGLLRTRRRTSASGSGPRPRSTQVHDVVIVATMVSVVLSVYGLTEEAERRGGSPRSTFPLAVHPGRPAPDPRHRLVELRSIGCASSTF